MRTHEARGGAPGDSVSGPHNWDDNGDISPAYYGVFAFNGETKFVLREA